MATTNKHQVEFNVHPADNELVLVVDRHELIKQGVGTDGIYPFNLNGIDPKAFGYLARDFADNKSPTSIAIGKLLPQILGYFQITNSEGRILTYRRKGKEKGLLGKLSIGVGGHVDLLDGITLLTTSHYDSGKGISTHTYPFPLATIGQVIRNGAERELLEEIGLKHYLANPVEGTDGKPGYMDWGYGYDRILSSFADPTSSVHVGLPREVIVEDISQLKYDETEFNAVEWLTKDELKELKAKLEAEQSELSFETWSALLVDSF